MDSSPELYDNDATVFMPPKLDPFFDPEISRFTPEPYCSDANPFVHSAEKRMDLGRHETDTQEPLALVHPRPRRAIMAVELEYQCATLEEELPSSYLETHYGLPLQSRSAINLGDWWPSSPLSSEVGVGPLFEGPTPGYRFPPSDASTSPNPSSLNEESVDQATASTYYQPFTSSSPSFGLTDEKYWETSSYSWDNEMSFTFSMADPSFLHFDAEPLTPFERINDENDPIVASNWQNEHAAYGHIRDTPIIFVDENVAPSGYPFATSPFDPVAIPEPSGRGIRVPFRVLHEKKPAAVSSGMVMSRLERIRRKAPPPLRLVDAEIRSPWNEVYTIDNGQHCCQF